MSVQGVKKADVQVVVIHFLYLAALAKEAGHHGSVGAEVHLRICDDVEAGFLEPFHCCCPDGLFGLVKGPEQLVEALNGKGPGH